MKNEQERVRKLEYNMKNNPLRPSTKSTKIITIDCENSLKTRLRKNNPPVNLINSNTSKNQSEIEDSVSGDHSNDETILKEVSNQPITSIFSDILNKSETCDNNDLSNVSSTLNQPKALIGPQPEKLSKFRSEKIH